MDKKVLYGNKKILDSGTIIVDGSEPIQITYNEGKDVELRLIFNFNILDDPKSANGIRLEPLGEAASFQVDVVKGKSGQMSEMKPIAESDNEILYLYSTFSASLHGHIRFVYSLLSEEIDFSQSIGIRTENDVVDHVSNKTSPKSKTSNKGKK